MDMTNPLVSIIMPAYNAEQYIDEAIQSVINQTYNNWELIIINDGSTDKTLNCIEAFVDNRIVLIDQDNKGVSVARNVGLESVKGEFITFLDADDALPKSSLENRVNYLKSNLDVDLTDGIIQVKDVQLKKLQRIYHPYYHGNLLPKLVALDSRVFFNICYMFRKKILGKIRFKEGMTHAEDLLFYIELSNQNYVTYGFIENDVYFYRSGNDSAMLNLIGLEKGYYQLLNTVKRLENISLKQNIILRIKIAKILFLSFLRNKNYIKSIMSLYHSFSA